MKIVFLATELLTLCGVSKHLYNILMGLKDNNPNNKHYVICGGGDAVGKFKDLGIPIIVNRNFIHKPRSVKGHIFASIYLYNFVNKNKIDIIHAHHHYSASIAEKASKLLPVKTVMTNHGFLQKQGLLNHYSSQNIITLNKSIERLLIKKFQDKKNIFVLSHGFLIPPLNIRVPNGEIQILLASRIVEEKGIDIFLRALTYLDRELLKKIKVKIAGLGYDLYKLKGFVNDNDLPVSFLGKVVNIDERFKYSDIFIFPSIAKYEGLPTAVIEAGIHSNIIVSSDFAHHDTFLKYGINSINFKQVDYFVLSKIIKLLLNRIQDFQHLGERAYNDFKKEFDLKKVSIQLVDIYKSILHS